MQWATNHAIQDESEYMVDGTTFRNYDTKSHGVVSMYDALRQSFNIPALKAWQQTKQDAGGDAPKNFAKKLVLITKVKSDLLKYLVVHHLNSHLPI